MSEKIQGWREEIDDSGYHWLVLRDAQGRLLSVPESREPAYISAGLASRPMAKLLNALTSERDEAVREAKRWKAHHDHQVAAKRDGHEKQKAHYEALLAEAVRVAGELRSKAALADQVRTSIIPATEGVPPYVDDEMLWTADWLSRYDALTQGGDLPLKEQE